MSEEKNMWQNDAGIASELQSNFWLKIFELFLQ